MYIVRTYCIVYLYSVLYVLQSTLHTEYNSIDEQADVQSSSPISLTPEKPTERSSSKGGKKLIEEVDSSGSRASASARSSAPEYKLELRGGERSGGEQETHYLLNVHLPHISSASECELDATEVTA